MSDQPRKLTGRPEVLAAFAATSRGEPAPQIQIRSWQAEVKSYDPETRTVTALASTPEVDRDGEIIEPKAFRKSLAAYRKNPVVVAGHRYSTESGQPTVIGRVTQIKATDEGLPFQAQFANTPLADQYASLYEGGFMRAFSVGFIPVAWDDANDTDQKKPARARRTYTEVELLEISAVAVPSNREALVAAAIGGSALAEGMVRDLHLAEAICKSLQPIGSPSGGVLISEEIANKMGITLQRMSEIVDKINETQSRIRSDLADPDGAYARRLLESGLSDGEDADLEGHEDEEDADDSRLIQVALKALRVERQRQG